MGKYQAYPEYIDAESKWLDMLPAKWKRAPLKHLVAIRITDGPHETPDFVDDGVPFLSAEAVKNNTLDFTKKRGYITRELHEVYSKKCLPQLDDVFMIKSGNTTGNIAIVETTEEFNIWSPLALIRANRQKVLPRFVYYAMRADYFRTSVELSWSQGTQPNIGMAVIENLHIPFGTLEEQQGIANFLDHETTKIDTLIEQQQQLIQLLKEKRQAVISHAVTKGLSSLNGGPNAPMKDSGVEWLGEVPGHWKLCPLKYAIELQRGHDLPSDSRVEGNVPVVSSGGVIAYHNEVKALGPGIVTGRYGTIGEFYLEERDYWPLNTALYSVNTFENNVKYLWYMLQSLKHLFVLNSMKSAVPGVDRNDLNPEVIALPHDIIEQQQIVEYLDAKLIHFDNVEREAFSAIQLMQERRTALISAAVTGKIDVRNWQTPQQ